MTTQLDVRLTEQYLTQLQNITAAGMRALIQVWAALPGIDESDIAQFARLAAPLLEGTGTATAASTAGYLRQFTGARVAISDITISQDMRHPFIGVWRDLNRGVPYTDALQTGRDRAASLAQERVEAAQNEVAERLEQSGLTEVGWRRVPQGATCSWCVVVSTQRYKTAASASFGHGHGGVNYCDCKKVPIYGQRDPGRVINENILSQWKKANKADKPPAYFDVDDGNLVPRP